MIFDEKVGIAFEGYNAELIRAFLILVHYTDLDTTPYDTGEDRQALYDILATHDMWPDIMGRASYRRQRPRRTARSRPPARSQGSAGG